MNFLRDTLRSYSYRKVLEIAFISLAYFVFGRLSLRLAFFNPSATPVWPPTGIAIAAFLIFGPKVWPGVFLAALAVNFSTTSVVETSIAIAIGNTLEGLVAAYLVKRVVGTRNPFLNPVGIVIYIFLAGVISTMISATIGVTSLYLARLVDSPNYLKVWLTWWFGDMGGALIVTPAIVLTGFNRKLYTNALKYLEVIFLMLLLIVPPILIFGGYLPVYFIEYPIAFIPIPILVWIAFRFGPRETSIAILILSVIAIFGTLSGFGPFVRSDQNSSLLIVQVFEAIMFLVAMPLSAAIDEQKKIQLHYKTLIESTPDPVFEIDLNGKILFVNDQALRAYGFSKSEEIIGKSRFELIAPEDVGKIRDMISNIITKGGKFTNVEYTSVRKDGTRFLSSSSGSLLHDVSGSPLSIISVIHDITLAKALDQAKTDFVSIASHQLRTPLGSMRWNLEMLLKGKDGEIPGNIKEVVVDVYSATRRLIKLVNQLLDITRVDQGRASDNATEVNIVSVINGLISDLKSELLSKEVHISLETKTPRIEILIDELKFQQVMMNLLINAVIYNKRGGSVDVSISEEDGFVEIAVKDTGIGISKADQGKIFTKFFRSKTAKELNAEGTGLGLYLVKSYVDKWGGKVSFESNDKTTFKIYLPKKTKPIN